MELNQNRSEFAKLGLGVAALSYDSVAVLHNFAERKGIAYPLLSDPDSAIIRRVGIFNDTVPRGNFFYGIPWPGVFVLDKDGRVKAKYFEQDFRQRYSSADILVHLFGFAPGAARADVNGHLAQVTTSASNIAVHSGERIALVAEVNLRPGVHVYAPGVEGYIPIDWRLDSSPAYQVHDVEWPPSHILYLKAIDEKVPVYEGRIRLVRDVTIGGAADGPLTIAGAFRYQACDDHMCYKPETLPLKWTLTVEPHDRTRVPPELQRK